ncbi:MAG: hypothetical protein IGS48_17525 [Oscillatoriales cyanobacterium C42_A2020_001]|nr:hypothetical protein [Leptolyngbyaceae cyanobacterium C42_A2020_001]
MPTSPSGPYQSRIVRAVVRQTRHLFERGQSTVRRVQVAANWSAQILLYPVYALFQTGRLVGRALAKTVQGESLLLLEKPEEQYEIPLKGDTSELTAETPVQNLLRTVQSLVLAKDVPVLVMEEVSIRAIASLMDSKSLVLVTNHNQILDVLTPEQQYLLNQRIVYEVAILGRQTRTWKLPLQRAQRFLRAAGDWVQTRVANALSLEDESSSDSPLLAQPDVDVPVKQCLLAVREVMPATRTAILIASSKVQAASLTGRCSPLPDPPVHIRGVASLLSTQALVLVTNQNESLDILTSAQQQLLHQRIVWEVAHYLRYRRSRNFQATGLPPLRPPSRRSLMLPPVRAFQWLMAWMQSGSVAASANLFQEASWNACPLPTPATPPLPVSRSTRKPAPTLSQRFSAARARLSGKPSPSALIPSPSPTSALSTSALVTTSVIHPAQARKEIAVAPLNSPSTSVVAQPLEQSASTTGDRSGRSPDYIDTHVTLMGYEQTWLERIVHWLDKCFLWLEKRIGALWKALMHRC